MGFSKTNWYSKVRNKLNFHKSSSSPRSKTVTLQANCEETFVAEEENEASSTPEKKVLSREDVAAIKIQALFRAHLARQAFRALRSLVKLQALVRGVSVRKQSRIALHCMHALVRLQVRVRARQLLGIQN